MKNHDVDLFIAGAGPVGLMSAFLANQCGMTTMIVDKSEGPLQVGRADALNARTLQLLEVAGLFDELYPKGKPCNTSSVWSEGKFLSRQSSWWDELEGCMHKHFLMLGQSFVEQLLDEKLNELNASVKRQTSIEDLQTHHHGCEVKLSNGEVINAKYVIGSDGSRSFVRNKFDVPFEITRPQIVWAVIDGVVDTDFEKVPEIIVFQTETSDVAWIPREGEIDRFYIRMDKKDFTIEEATEKINRAMAPKKLSFKEIVWFSQFSVKESVAERFRIDDRVFLAGDSCHIHSVNGGQGLNTGLADAFNLIWKLHQVEKLGANPDLLDSYEAERKPVALSVIETSGELVRTTKYSETGTHAEDYVKIVRKRAGNITGMGIQYGKDDSLAGTRLHDINLHRGSEKTRLYSLLDYTKYSLVVFSDSDLNLDLPDNVQLIQLGSQDDLWSSNSGYSDMAILVRPDSYIEKADKIENVSTLLNQHQKELTR